MAKVVSAKRSHVFLRIKEESNKATNPESNFTLEDKEFTNDHENSEDEHSMHSKAPDLGDEGDEHSMHSKAPDHGDEGVEHPMHSKAPDHGDEGGEHSMHSKAPDRGDEGGEHSMHSKAPDRGDEGVDLTHLLQKMICQKQLVLPSQRLKTLVLNLRYWASLLTGCCLQTESKRTKKLPINIGLN
ncbi:hypothetical protein OS493_032561 [Desmophyllum pertusum]|uniref:Uncharacterized protein n=1 Tax=Desmophyllum pertusum TaxID=174260 RepID=A0A9W9YVV8_9CNID|nr:hypothetical protein OS493_032561 [Desmophyllum pertusum]